MPSLPNYENTIRQIPLLLHIFGLKNRQPNKWRDKAEAETNDKINGELLYSTYRFRPKNPTIAKFISLKREQRANNFCKTDLFVIGFVRK